VNLLLSPPQCKKRLRLQWLGPTGLATFLMLSTHSLLGATWSSSSQDFYWNNSNNWVGGYLPAYGDNVAIEVASGGSTIVDRSFAIKSFSYHCWPVVSR
jgi:hypothetical protein